ncbi:MAG TPA: hypothetical protein VFN23_18000 [Ktedonobacteraceae bacterium]|nr:hypothetical protein [Ktedonobacteraceae bacterium]
MATTGELRAIIQDLQLVDVGDAASYLGEEDVHDEADQDMRFPVELNLLASDFEITSASLI